MIRLEFTGNLGKKAEVRELQDGKKVINFSVGVSIGYGENRTTQWVECSKFTDKTDVANYLLSGTKVFIAGEPRLRHWEKDGKSGTSLSLNVSEIELLGDAKRSGE